MALFTFPFLSQFVNNWKPSEIGEGKAPDDKPDVTNAEMDTLSNFCFRDANPLSTKEQTILAGFEAAASVVAILFTIWTIANTMATASEAEPQNFIVSSIIRTKESMKQLWGRVRPSWVNPVVLEALLLFLPMVLAGGLLWGIFRLRQAQKTLAEATNNRYEDNEWTFGQVVAIIMFTPALSDMVYSWWYEDLK
jgi:hypothetical protein